LHTILRHLEPHDMNLVLVRIHLGLQGDVVPFMTFYRVRVAYRPTLAVFVAHERRAVSANFSCDTNSFTVVPDLLLSGGCAPFPRPR
jgi:hypothetical protein